MTMRPDRRNRQHRGHRGEPPTGLRPLDAGQFAFHGFGDLTRRVERKVGRAGIRSGDPVVSVVEDALFVPASIRMVAGQPELYGGLATADGRPIDTLRRGGGEVVGGLVAPVAIAPEWELDDEVVYLGWLFDAFGHFLLESLARAWYLTEVDPSVKVVFHNPNPPGWSLSGTRLRVLESFGTPLDRILLPEVPTRLRRVIVPEQLFELQHAAHERVIRPYREAAARIVGDPKPSAQPVYLSRRLLPSSQRPIVGEGELEDVLRENGFLVAHPETMTFEDQVRLVNGHTDLFAAVGSAAHAVLFAHGRPALHLLANGDRVSPNYFLCSKLAESPTTLVNCLGTSGRSILPGAPTHTPDFAEVPKLVEYLEGRGLLTKHLRASLAGRSPELRSQYDEAWLYAYVRTAASRRQALPPEVEREALGLAERSWPVSAILALYYSRARRDAARANSAVQRFATLATAEFDMNRLVHYRAEVE